MQPAGGNEDSAGGGLGKALADNVAGLDQHGILVIAELATAGIIMWNVRRDQCGTPVARYQPQVPWASLAGPDRALDEDALHQVIRSEVGGNLMIVRSAPGGLDITRALSLLRAHRPDAVAYDCQGDLGILIKRAIEQAPLTQWYELIVARRTPSGELELRGCQLFPVGAQRGDRLSLTVTCEPSDDGRTVFAVAAIEPVRHFHLVSMRSARLPGGTYRLTAVLARPGRVDLLGLPAELVRDRRSWRQLVESMPRRMAVPQPVHLVCVIETGGTVPQLRSRLSRVNKLIRHAAGGGDVLAVSVITYGAHSFSRQQPDSATEILVWAAPHEVAQSAIVALHDRPRLTAGYPHAAQLECVLTDLAGYLSGAAGQAGRPVLVAVGGLPPFPDKVDPSSEILPCPHRRSWRSAMTRLRELPDMTLGAIRDGSPRAALPGGGRADDAWAQLSARASAWTSAFDVEGFATDLGLLSAAAQHVPFPILEGGGSSP